MMKAKKILAPAVALLVVLAITAPASGYEWVFFGFSKYTPAVDQVGAEMEAYGIFGTGTIPAPLDFNNPAFEYTIYVNDMIVATYNENPGPPFVTKQISFTGGTVYIYADATTAADYSDLSTFVDGDLILIASLYDGYQMNLSDIGFPPDGYFNGTGLGYCDFVGGSQLGDLATLFPWVEWFFSGIDVADANPPMVPVPAGFDRVFDIKIIPPVQLPAEPSTWGQIKDMYR